MIETIVVLAIVGGLIKLGHKHLKKDNQLFLEAGESSSKAIPRRPLVFIGYKDEKEEDLGEGIPELVKLFNNMRAENKEHNDYVKHKRYLEAEARNINFRTELGRLHQLNLEQHFPEAAISKQTAN